MPGIGEQRDRSGPESRAAFGQNIGDVEPDPDRESTIKSRGSVGMTTMPQRDAVGVGVSMTAAMIMSVFTAHRSMHPITLT